jgi:hypothetical protein
MIGRRRATIAALATLLPAGTRAQAAWRSRPIRMIVPDGPGGSADQVARLYAERFSAGLGQQVIVEDKPGASGGVGAQMVATSAPDGYTVLLSPTAIMAITPGVRKVPYNPDDLVAVCRLSTPILSVTITNALGARNWQEFVALAKANPANTGSARRASAPSPTAPARCRPAPPASSCSIRPTRPSSMPRATSSTAASSVSDEAARIAADPDMQAKLLLVAQYAHHRSPAAFPAGE